MAGIPRFAATKLQQLRMQILARPEFDSLDTLKLKRIEFERRLVQFLESLPLPAVATAPLLLPNSDENGLLTI
jgi:hypothetical protein